MAHKITAMPLTEEELREEAKKRIGFKAHLSAYIIVNIFLWGLWFVTSPTAYKWPIWPTMGWAVGLAFHYVSVYHINSFFSVEKEMDKLRNEGK